MENLIFGTYNVSNDGLTISYNAPSMLPKEVMEKISFNGDVFSTAEKSEKPSGFNDMVKAVAGVPKPKK